MVRLEDLYTVYYMARANKRRSEDAVLFELDYERRLAGLLTAINERTYRANANYTVNSYYGMLKVRNEFHMIQRLHAEIDPRWWCYLDMNWDRYCVVARPGYEYKDRLKYKVSRM